jgi:hypothetical protein
MMGCFPLLAILLGVFLAAYSQLMGDTGLLVFGLFLAVGGVALAFEVLRSQEKEKLNGLEKTGLVCPSCRESVAVIESSMPPVITMRCPLCGYRWQAEEPGTKKD